MYVKLEEDVNLILAKMDQLLAKTLSSKPKSYLVNIFNMAQPMTLKALLQ